MTVVPGVRNPLESISQKDQKRVLTPQQALAQGADYLVMGRGILAASEPLRLLQQIKQCDVFS